MSCYCGKNKAYSQCCGQFIEGNELPETAEALMRSRYSAYASQNKMYLVKTWHSTTLPTELSLSGEKVEWVGLKILNTKKGLATDVEGYVEFKAFYYVNGQHEVLHECSRFLKEKGLELLDVRQGDDFNADFHEAITQIPAPSKKLKGKIIDVIEKGYKLGDKIIRFPKVVIGQ